MIFLFRDQSISDQIVTNKKLKRHLRKYPNLPILLLQISTLINMQNFLLLLVSFCGISILKMHEHNTDSDPVPVTKQQIMMKKKEVEERMDED